MSNLVKSISRLHELDHVIRTSSADVVIVTESELDQNDVAVIPGYNMFRALPGANGKTRLLAYVKDTFSTSVINVTPIEIWLTINLCGSSLTIAGVYRQWRDDECAALERFYKNCETALKYSRVLILGDFNLDVTRTNDCTYSRAAMAGSLSESMESMGYHFAGPNTPTYTSFGTYNGSKRNSTIDLVYTRGLTSTVTVLDCAATDHRPVLATVTYTKAAISSSNSAYVRNLKKVSTTAFCNAIEAHLPDDLYQITDLDLVHKTLVCAVTAALDRLAPLKMARTKEANGFRLSLAPDTLETMRQRDSVSTTHPLFRALRNKAKKLVHRDAINGAMRAVDAAGGNPKKLWNFARQHMGNSRPSIPASLLADDVNNYFVDKIQKIRQRIPDAVSTTRLTTRASHPKFVFRFPSAGKVREVIYSLGNTGALGVDNIGVAALKLGADAIAAPLAHIARLSFSQGVVPTGFKMAIVTPVFKGHGKDINDKSSYRPISILPAMSKVLEILVMEPLTAHLSQLLPNSQFGFRKRRSTVAAIATAHGAWSKAKALGKTIVVAAYDMSSAFDTIDTNLLCTRLEELKVCGTPNKWFRSYLTNRQQRVSAHGKISSELPVSYGVPQGSILGPVLFLTMMAGFPDFAAIDESKGGTIGYADDICCWATGDSDAEAKSELERVSSRLLEYAAIHKLAVNESKTQVMWVRTATGPSISIGNTTVGDSNSLDLLGVCFEKSLRSTPFLKAQASATRRINGAVAALSRHLPSHIVSKVARALVIGKTGYGAAAVIPPRLHRSEPNCSAVAAIQVAINDVARSATGNTRKDKLPVATLLQKSSLPSLNQLTVRSLAVETWKAIKVRDGPDGLPNPLGLLVGDPGNGVRFTRTVAAGHLAPPLKMAMPTFIWYSYMLWNSYPCLREATTLSSAKMAANTISKLVPL